MRIICLSFNEFNNYIKNNDVQIIMFGSGVIGQISVPTVLNSYGLVKHVEAFIDNDKKKWNTYMQICGKSVPVYSIEYLDTCEGNYVLLINISRFSDVLHQLDQLTCMRDVYCFIMPMMLVHNFCNEPSKGSPVLSNRPLIPKKLHYMWLGGKSIPTRLQRCIDSWKKWCPDFEIIKWDENNYDVENNIYTKQAYDKEAYGFVPDYARLDIVYNNGGIYLDTDVELLCSLEPMLYQEAFCSLEKWQVINLGGGFGAVKGNKVIKMFLDARRDISFINSDGSENRTTSPFFDTKTALKMGYDINGITQYVSGINIYAYDYFMPYDYMTGSINITENTIAIHWYDGSWLDSSSKNANIETSNKYNLLYEIALEEGRKILKEEL